MNQILNQYNFIIERYKVKRDGQAKMRGHVQNAILVYASKFILSPIACYFFKLSEITVLLAKKSNPSPFLVRSITSFD